MLQINTLIPFIIFFGCFGIWHLGRRIIKSRTAKDLADLALREAEIADRTKANAAVASLLTDVNLTLSDMLQTLACINAALEAFGDPAALRDSVLGLTKTTEESAGNIEKLADSAVLMARGSRMMNDNITALRSIVYGGGRADDFPATTNDPEGLQRANMESDIHTLMQDSGYSRADAERRVRDMYATRSR